MPQEACAWATKPLRLGCLRSMAFLANTTTGRIVQLGEGQAEDLKVSGSILDPAKATQLGIDSPETAALH